MNKSIILLLLTISYVGYSQNVQFYYTKAREALAARDDKAYFNYISEANKLHPYHQGIMYHLGIASALNGDVDKAAFEINKALQIDASFDLELEALNPFKESKWLIDLKALQKELKESVLKSDTAFIISDRTAHIEAITFDPVSKSFFLGSIHKRKIIMRDASGKITDFIKPAEYDLASVFGVKVDAKKGVLWVSSSPMLEMEDYDSTIRSAVYKFDVKNGMLIHKYEIPAQIDGSVFGDLILGIDGNVYISDSQNNIIFKVNESQGTLDEYFHSDEFWNIQGICLSTDNKFLYVSDYIKGLYQVDLENKKLTKLINLTQYSLKGTDGLLFYNNSLIAIQNGVQPMRTMRYFLNEAHDTITKAEIIDWAHPAFGEPTIGHLTGNRFIYVANSSWNAYDEQRQFKEDLAKDVIILEYQLPD